jgi:hypothetical protein
LSPLQASARWTCASRARLYYTSSADLGATWAPPVLLSGSRPDTSGEDLPRLTVTGQHVYVTWGYRGDYRAHVIWSTDGGESWARATESPHDCINLSEAAVVRGTPYVACAGFMPSGDSVAGAGGNPFTGIRVYRLDPAGTLRLEATLEDFKGVWPRLIAEPDGSLVLAADLYSHFNQPDGGWNKCCALMSRSLDGRTWSAPIDVRDAMRSGRRWTHLGIIDAQADALGMIHLLVTGSAQAHPANGAAGVDARLVHAVFDSRSGHLLTESSPTAPTAEQRFRGIPIGASLALGDSGAGMVAWTFDRALYYTRLEASRPRRP